MVEGLPCHTFPTDDGGVDMKCPTEIAITDRRALLNRGSIAATDIKRLLLDAIFEEAERT